MDAFPAFLPLAGRRVVVVGDGPAADAKARLFEGSPAEVVRLSDPAGALLPERYYGGTLVFIAGEADFCRAAADAARAAGALVNVVDRPALSDFFTPAIIDRGAVVGAIGTGGAAPVLATRLRAEWEARWPQGLGRLAEMLRGVQAQARSLLPDPGARRPALRRLLDGPAAAAALAGDSDRAQVLAREELAAHGPPAGRLIRLTQPREPDLLTLRDLQALGGADVVVADALSCAAILSYARRDALQLDETTPAALDAWLAQGLTVVTVS